ncbi:MAG TPA: T9SS type A sorting domain-containing protein, partial [Puia sp.]|nr:T9SS type A sorting domain-containing protein [Puia sp.]
VYKTLSKKFILPLILLLAANGRISAQACATAQGNQTTYGTNNVWIGYVYTGMNFNNYQGYVNEGSASSPNFDESFGGNQVNYPTNGCSVYTDGFSVRYKLTQALSGNYTITVGGDDGYRLSLDGGSTWAINNWNDHGYTTTSYTVTLSGSTNLVLEYYENGGANRVTFSIVQNCTGTGDPTVYGTGTTWIGYLYQGMNFGTYKGQVTEGSASGPNFDENFNNPGGSNTNTYNTNSCSVQTYQFSARYRLTQNLAAGSYVFTVGGDDGYRFSLDGGNTWAINNWNDHSYTTSTYSAALSGTTNMVLEYYQNGGYDRISFVQTSTTLPVTLTSWSGSARDNNQALLKWTATNAVDFDHFVVQRSTDGSSFEDIHTIPANDTTEQSYSYTDQDTYDGKLYYRLEMVDRDGKTNYSTIISISLKEAQGIRIYPTRVESGSFFIESSASIRQARLELFDINGRRLQENEWAALEGRQQVTVNNNASLPAGAYIVRLSANQTTLAKQIIIIK